jgi:hypothetical protein
MAASWRWAARRPWSSGRVSAGAVAASSYHAAMAHDAAAKARARDAYRQGGGTHATRITGIPLRTIQRWATAGGWVHELAPLDPADGAGGNGAPEPAGSKNGATPSASFAPLPRQLGQRFLAESAAFLEAARAAREHHRARDAREYMTGAAIAQDKARQAGVTELEPSPGWSLTPEQEQARNDRIVDMLNLWFGRMLEREPETVLGMGQRLVEAATEAIRRRDQEHPPSSGAA